MCTHCVFQKLSVDNQLSDFKTFTLIQGAENQSELEESWGKIKEESEDDVYKVDQWI